MCDNPDGPVVPWVDVLAVDGEDGKPTAVLFEHAAHPVIVHSSSTLITADYPGFACRRIRHGLGAGVVPMFLQGCGANINGHPLQGGFEECEKAGDKLGDAVLAALEGATPLTADVFNGVTRRLMLPTEDPPTLEEVEQVIEEHKAAIESCEGPQAPRRALHDQLDALLDLRRMVANGERRELRLDMTAVTLAGQWCLMALAGEMFCEYQLWMDEHSPFEHTMVAAYTNGIGGYVATDAELTLKERGGYEAGAFPVTSACALCTPTRLALQVGTEKIIHQAAEEMWAEAQRHHTASKHVHSPAEPQPHSKA